MIIFCVSGSFDLTAETGRYGLKLIWYRWPDLQV